MNPFEKGMTSANGLHAVMTQDVASNFQRTINRTSYPFFYNPMWGRFGDTTEGPPGTFYRRGSSTIEYFWHMYDQVLLRPGLMNLFNHKSLKVLSEIKGTSLVKASGIPDDSSASDHLPLLFALRI